MPTVWIPALLRHLTNEEESTEVPGTTVGALIDALDVKFPGIKQRLSEGDAVRQGLALVIDGQVSRVGLAQTVHENSEVHFIPAIGGGSSIIRKTSRSLSAAGVLPPGEKKEPFPADFKVRLARVASLAFDW